MARWTSEGKERIFSGDKNVLYLYCGGGYTRLYVVRTHQAVYVKWVHIICKRTATKDLQEHLDSIMELYGLDSNVRFS